MTDILKKNFEKFRNEGYKEPLDILEDVFLEFGVDFYLIGATSKNLWIEGIDLNSPLKGTLDIDFAVYINEMEKYVAILDALILKGFKKTDKVYCLSFGDSIIDIIPFGGVQNGNMIDLPVIPAWSIPVSSYNETLPHSVEISNNFKIIPLHGLCIMKIMAYYDRPHARHKDIQDVYFICENYFRIFSNAIIDDYAELFSINDDEKIVGTIALGKKMKEILDSESELKSKVIETLKKWIPDYNEIVEDDLIEESQTNKQAKHNLLIYELIKELEK